MNEIGCSSLGICGLVKEPRKQATDRMRPVLLCLEINWHSPRPKTLSHFLAPANKEVTRVTVGVMQ